MEKIELSKKDYFEMYYVIEKILYIAHRASSREDCDNNAYSLAITFAKEKVVSDILNIRRKMSEYLSEEDRSELEKLLDPIDDIKIPYNLSLEELRDELKPFLPKLEKLKGK